MRAAVAKEWEETGDWRINLKWNACSAFERKNIFRIKRLVSCFALILYFA